MAKRWSYKEKQFISDYCEMYTDAQMASELRKLTGRHITMGSVRKQRQKLGKRKQCGRGISKLFKGEI